MMAESRIEVAEPPVRVEDIKVILQKVIPQKGAASVRDRVGKVEDERINRYANFPGLNLWDEVFPGILLGGR